MPNGQRARPCRRLVRPIGIPAAGWIYLHIEGKPYERGYQHGHLMAQEIPQYLERCAADLGDKTDAVGMISNHGECAVPAWLRPGDSGRDARHRRRRPDAGAQWQDRRIDLIDIVVANTTVEMGELAGARKSTATGLEGMPLDEPAYAEADVIQSPTIAVHLRLRGRPRATARW